MLKTITLKNGIKVATYALPQMRSVYISMTAKSGSIFDNEDNSGVAHYMEHILFEGTPSFPTSESFTQYIESLAGSYNAYTSTEIIKFYISLPFNHLLDGLKIAGEVFYEPTFPEEAIEKERNAILDEINQRKDSLWYKNGNFYKQTRYRANHPMLLDGGGSVTAVSKLTKTELLDYWSTFFFPANSYLTIVGNIDQSKIADQLEDVFKKYPDTHKFPGYPKLTNDDLSDRVVTIRHDKTLNTCYVDFTWPSFSNGIDLQEDATASVFRTILGASQGSRLNRTLRIQRGMVYSIGFWNGPMQEFGISGISTSTSLANLDEVIETIVNQVTNFFANGPTDEELTAAQNYNINRVLMSFDQPDNIVGWINGDLLWQDQPTSPDEYVEYIKKVNKTMIKQFIEKYYDLSKLNLIIQGPITNNITNVKKYTKMVELLK